MKHTQIICTLAPYLPFAFCLASHPQTYSIKDRRSEATRLSKMRLIRDPPLITTTAATPQDSPSTTMEPGMSFRQWGDLEVSNRFTTQ